MQPLSACRVVEPFRLVKVVTVIHHPTGLRESNVSSLEQEVLKAFQRGYNGITRNGILSEEILFRQYFVFDNFITFELKMYLIGQDKSHTPLKCPVPALLLWGRPFWILWT